MKVKSRFIVLSLFFFSFCVNADNAPFSGYGASLKSCGEFVADSSSRNYKHEYLVWLWGYFTAVNKHDESVRPNKNILAGKDSESILLWLKNYCNDNPLDNFLQATIALQDALQE